MTASLQNDSLIVVNVRILDVYECPGDSRCKASAQRRLASGSYIVVVFEVSAADYVAIKAVSDSLLNTTFVDNLAGTMSVSVGLALSAPVTITATVAITSGPGAPLGVVCGDGKREGLEECDDGNLLSEDGCSVQCMVEVGFICGGGSHISSDSCSKSSFGVGGVVAAAVVIGAIVIGSLWVFRQRKNPSQKVHVETSYGSTAQEPSGNQVAPEPVVQQQPADPQSVQELPVNTDAESPVKSPEEKQSAWLTTVPVVEQDPDTEVDNFMETKGDDVPGETDGNDIENGLLPGSTPEVAPMVVAARAPPRLQPVQANMVALPDMPALPKLEREPEEEKWAVEDEQKSSPLGENNSLAIVQPHRNALAPLGSVTAPTITPLPVRDLSKAGTRRGVSSHHVVEN